MKEVNVYNTHIEIVPYETWEIPKLEKKWSIWNDYEYDRVANYIENDTLYIPRGASYNELHTLTGVVPQEIENEMNPERMRYKYTMTAPPRDLNQRKVIAFLDSDAPFERNEMKTQFVVTGETGFGKTYCTIHSIIDFELKSIVITHTDDIKTQWYQSFLSKSTIREDRMLNIDSSDVIDDIIAGNSDYDVYLITHSLITTYASTHGWNKIRSFFHQINVGIKVIDETHKCFRNIMRIDFFSNVPKNFYLTATFDRNEKESQVFKKAFANAVQFGNELKGRKHVNYRFIFFNSQPSHQEQIGIKTHKGPSAYLYADYAFKKDTYHTLEFVFYKVFEKCMQIEGRTLIVVPKIENTFYLKEQIEEKYPWVDVGVINSKQKDTVNDEVKENAHVIISTIKSLGTGSHLDKLRNLIIMEPFSSKITADQLIGRLREYSKTDDTYVYDLINTGFKDLLKQVNRRFPTIEKKCKVVNQSTIRT